MSKKQPPSAVVLIATYGFLGGITSYLFGNNPGEIPQDIISELCPSIVVICLFLVYYECYDVMGVGIAKINNSDMLKKKYEDTATFIPEAVYLAQRAQLNQVEQFPCFLVSTISFSILVNGKLGATLAAVWGILRMKYASTYRNSVGIQPSKKGLGIYTIPCYFILNTMLMGSAIHGIRWMMI